MIGDFRGETSPPHSPTMTMTTKDNDSFQSSVFTSRHLDRLAEASRRLNAFVHANECRADALAADVRTVEADEQHRIDALLSRLKVLQHERGVAASDEAGDTSVTAGGIAEQRNKLEHDQARLGREVSRLRSQNALDQAQLEGGASCSPLFLP